MAEFSPADAALEGFRIGRENPGGLGVWTVVFFAASLLTAALMIRSGAAESLRAVFEILSNPQPDPAAFSAALQRAAPSLLAAYWPMMVAQVLVQAAVLRVALRGSRAYLRIGGDELRLLAALVMITVLTMLATFVVSLAGGVVAAAVPPLGAMIILVGSITVALVISTRLVLLYPLAVGEGSLSLPRAWALTKGRFMPILAARILAFVFFIIVGLLGSVISVAIRSVAGEAREGPVTSMAALMAPAELAAMAVESLLQALGAVLLAAPAVVIYRALSGRGRSEVS